MAKSSKVEDYWRQNNVENLLKDLTQLLARRMPPDPASAIVEHLQKKYPKSFKTPRQSITSPHSDIQNESLSDVQSEHRSSNLSQTTGTITIPTVGSAFTDLLKQQGNTTKPETMIKNLVFANRLGQQVVKMRKDIRSDKDILDEESIKPSRTRLTAAMDTTPETFQYTETTEELSVPQLVKYKQQIHMENDRRIHREQLAAVAKHQCEKEGCIQSDLSAKPEEIEQQKIHEDGDETSLPKPIKTDAKPAHKLSVKSKEEEDFLNDENVFRPQKHRERVRQKNRLLTPRLTMPYVREGSIADIRSIIRKNNENIICKVCGNIANAQEDPLQNTVRSLPPLPLTQSVETPSDAIDDWFAPIPEIQKSTSRTSDDVISPPIGSTTFRRNLFEANSDIVEHRPPIRPLVNTDADETKAKRLATPRVSESGVFARSPDAKTRHSPSPKKLQTEARPSLTNTGLFPDDSDEN